eukprot:TRINITY_DN4928_c1_g1_i1.p1 TRINITY_DN4928_c1_g1~~TRINITY_DN4928_c1_g1_i1.p1  ORF type:complete len:471 (+),score=58.14 TRINITY_DN4928_c1_g1_i1:78-1490(+)
MGREKPVASFCVVVILGWVAWALCLKGRRRRIKMRRSSPVTPALTVPETFYGDEESREVESSPESSSFGDSRDISPSPVRPLSQSCLGSHEDGFTTEGSSLPSPSPCSSPTSRRIRETHFVDKTVDENGNKAINQYTILSEIGRGSFSKVKLAFDDESGEPVALKIMHKSSVKSRYQKEIAIMKKLNHVNLVSLHEVIDDERCEQVYLVLEYVENGPLAHILHTGYLDKPPMTNKRIKRVLSDTVSGLSYLHSQGIAHKDLKPENLLEASDGRVKIADFGVSYFIESRTGITGNGTPAFSPPETLGLGRDDDRTHINPRAVDVWALGVTVYALKYGRLPFRCKSLAEMSSAVHSEDPITAVPDSPTSTDALLEDLIGKLLEKNPVERAMLHEVEDHPFLTGVMSKRDFSPINVSEYEIKGAVNKVVLIVKVKSMLRKRRLSASRTVASRSNSIKLSSIRGSDPVLPVLQE